MFLLPLPNSFTRSEYLNVFNVCSHDEKHGETFAIIIVLHFPIKESLSTYVNLDPLNGVCFYSWSKALIHSFNARRDLLISDESCLVYLFESPTSAPRSLPAKSIKFILPLNFWFSLMAISKMAWDLED